jgi:hypothetical protein
MYKFSPVEETGAHLKPTFSNLGVLGAHFRRILCEKSLLNALFVRRRIHFFWILKAIMTCTRISRTRSRLVKELILSTAMATAKNKHNKHNSNSNSNNAMKKSVQHLKQLK